ncbi:MAG: type I 3-dehydroquinate dehydratase, partial [Spirochaetota bacterium]
MSRLCFVLTASTLKENLKAISSIGKHLDCAELRADFLDPEEYRYIRRFPGLLGIPVILTIRRVKEGGKFSGGESERRELLRRGLHGKYSYVDIEEDVEDRLLEETAALRKVKIIRSFHEYNGVPCDLARRMQSLVRKPGEIPKAAVYPRTTGEFLHIITASRELAGFEKILLGMGPVGFPTRILAAHLGSFLSYCSQPSRQAAPGLIDPDTLIEVYRFKTIRENTKIFGIIGNPVFHSLSPRIHNTGFKRLNLNAVYLPFQTDNL